MIHNLTTLQFINLLTEFFSSVFVVFDISSQQAHTITNVLGESDLPLNPSRNEGLNIPAQELQRNFRRFINKENEYPVLRIDPERLFVVKREVPHRLSDVMHRVYYAIDPQDPKKFLRSATGVFCKSAGFQSLWIRGENPGSKPPYLSVVHQIVAQQSDTLELTISEGAEEVSFRYWDGQLVFSPKDNLLRVDAPDKIDIEYAIRNLFSEATVADPVNANVKLDTWKNPEFVRKVLGFGMVSSN